VYAGSDWTAVRIQVFSEPASRRHDHFVMESVVNFPSAENAERFRTLSLGRWSSCQGRAVTRTFQARQESWRLGDAIGTGDTLMIKLIQDDTANWACLRGLKVHNNVAVDVEACGRSDATIGAASTILDKITAKIPG
jgi:hypothetical protein